MVKSRQKRKALIAGGAVAIFLTLCSIVYVAMGVETVELNDRTRNEFGGTYAKLNSGVTHYRLEGPREGTVVVMLHGATISVWDFDLQVGPLVKAGYRVLGYDALGRGFSDRPDVKYTRELYERQLTELLENLGIRGKVVLMGHSLGGARAIHYAAKHPGRVRGIILVAPVIDSIKSIPPFVVCNTPVLGHFVYRVAMRFVLANRANAQWASADVDRGYYDDLYGKQETIEGYQRSVCSMFQTDLVGDYKESYLDVDESGIPVVLIYGEDDRIIGLEHVDELKAKTRNFTFAQLKDAAHSPHVQAVDEFNGLMLDFLGGL